ncbi:hypothetical protein EA687_13235 [Acinetobacter baumannii]|nr:hypothetical protein [Acinetobacter baumannii]PPC36978.1 hypothetical protein AbaMCR54_16755 [Acinetobacter baumannii]PPC52396.1 hypothetical protein AbaHEU2_11375 [Acinetobacter baumannii]RQN77821.1 hypothetical protein EAH71_04915 [Acinetobacter baumannii]RSQ97973.1 hypothetical protein EA687_13235 [Acinetobacter baumannii]
MKRSIAYRQIFHQCFNATCIFTNATSSINFANRLKTINRPILLKYQAIILLYPVGILLAKNIYHRSKFNRQSTFLPENKYLTHSIIIS